MPAKFQFIDYTSEYTIQLFTFTAVLNNEIQYCVERTAVVTQIVLFKIDISGENIINS